MLPIYKYIMYIQTDHLYTHTMCQVQDNGFLANKNKKHHNIKYRPKQIVNINQKNRTKQTTHVILLLSMLQHWGCMIIDKKLQPYLF